MKARLKEPGSHDLIITLLIDGGTMISHFRWVADPRHHPHLLITLEVQGDSIYVIKGQEKKERVTVPNHGSLSKWQS